MSSLCIKIKVIACQIQTSAKTPFVILSGRTKICLMSVKNCISVLTLTDTHASNKRQAQIHMYKFYT